MKAYLYVIGLIILAEEMAINHICYAANFGDRGTAVQIVVKVIMMIGWLLFATGVVNGIIKLVRGGNNRGKD